MLDIQQHEYFLKRILREIINDPELNNQLVLKGGTCLYIFYGLDRFSVDLDFGLTLSKDLAVDKMNQILGKYLKIDEGRFRQGQFGWLWEASYMKGQRQMQIDVSKRQYPDKYEIKQFYGLSLKTLDQPSLFAHKLCAILDRQHFQNRDLFDSHFMFEKMFEINEQIILFRTGKNLIEYLKELEIFIKNQVDKNKMLQGLGELLDEKRKFWVKTKLIDELLAQLRLKIESGV
ncbi:nucleotidyl transferase AbiEii/AbiGii toxin family protein [Patescibacteria group bacterium]|nr:nucleotidyl transferase AbiEii/AbiGii toxin family protein [Patescibacteria group bacterium]